jgi:hypothetical protein
MSKPKKKFGLQKDFSTIFEGVWIPPKPRGKGDPPSQDRPSGNQTPVPDRRNRPVETPKSDEQEQPTRARMIDELNHDAENRSFPQQDYASDNAALDEQGAAVERPLPERRQDAEETDAANERNQHIEKIISSMKCSKGFVCYKSNFKVLCKVKKAGEGKIIECSPENQGACEYRFSFMGKVFCKCPLRHYIAGNLNM